jgi:hypothetical protein
LGVARFTHPRNGELVDVDAEAVGLLDMLDEGFDFLQADSLDLAAALTDEMEVMFMEFQQFVVILPITQINGGNEMEILKQFQRPVDGGNIDRLADRIDPLMDLLRGGKALNSVQNREDDLSLGGQSESTRAELLIEELFTRHRFSP